MDVGATGRVVDSVSYTTTDFQEASHLFLEARLGASNERDRIGCGKTGLPYPLAEESRQSPARYNGPSAHNRAGWGGVM